MKFRFSNNLRSWLIGFVRATVLFSILFALAFFTRGLDDRAAAGVFGAVFGFSVLVVMLRPE